MGEFKRSRLFAPRPLKFRESAYERREDGFIVLAVEPHSVPSTKGSLHGNFMKASARASLLETYTFTNLTVSGARLVFQEEVIFKQRKIRGNIEKCFAKMDEDGDLENGVRFQMD
jgi:hypothetical protein